MGRVLFTGLVFTQPEQIHQGQLGQQEGENRVTREKIRGESLWFRAASLHYLDMFPSLFGLLDKTMYLRDCID